MHSGTQMLTERSTCQRARQAPSATEARNAHRKTLRARYSASDLDRLALQTAVPRLRAAPSQPALTDMRRHGRRNVAHFMGHMQRMARQLSNVSIQARKALAMMLLSVAVQAYCQPRPVPYRRLDNPAHRRRRRRSRPRRRQAGGVVRSQVSALGIPTGRNI
jgi:hypothetical protein